jgi:hypothetical protein
MAMLFRNLAPLCKGEAESGGKGSGGRGRGGGACGVQGYLKLCHALVLWIGAALHFASGFTDP